MSCFVKEIEWEKWFCIDDYFWNHNYWYVKMNEEEKESGSPWELFSVTSLEWRGWNRKVYKPEELISMKNATKT